MAAIAPVVQSPLTLLEHFCLLEQPFGVTPDPAYLYLSPRHNQALRTLSEGIRADRGFMALVAEPGMGKTTLLHRLMEDLGESASVVFLFQTQCDIRQFLQYFLAELGIRAEGMGLVAMHRHLNEILFNEMLAGKRFVLIVDEAQNLSDPVLETLRMLSNFETPHAKLLQIILAGQPGLEEKFAQPAFTQLRQRIASISHLSKLSPVETAQYIECRLSVAGYRGKNLFTEAALHEIERVSEGIPRNINMICFDALNIAFSRWQRTISAGIIQEVAVARKLETPAPRPQLAPPPAPQSLPLLELKSSYQPPEHFHPGQWILGGNRESRRNELVSTQFIRIEQPGGSSVLATVPNEIRFDMRRAEMTNTGVARATSRKTFGSEPIIDLQSTLAVRSDSARFDKSIAPLEDSLRLAARIQAMASEVDHVFLFAGVTGHDGVSDVSTGVALALARTGKGSVLLVDADLRSPSLHARFGVNLNPGLSELIETAVTGNEFTPIGNSGVTLLPAGERTDPLSLFSSPAFSAFLKKAREEFRFVILKAPAILSSAEVDILVQSADGVVMVIPNGKQRKPAVAEAKKALADLKAKVLGAVLCEKESQLITREG